MNCQEILRQIHALGFYSPADWWEYLGYFDHDTMRCVTASLDHASESAGELRARILRYRGAESAQPDARLSPKIVTYARLPGLRSTGVGVVSGCYDLLHIDHLRGIAYAKRFLGAGPKLTLCALLLSDEHIRHKKGPDRPILNINERLSLLSHVPAVDWVVCLQEPDCLAALDMLGPRFFFKQEKDRGQEAVRREIDLVQSHGGEIVILPDREGVSTTRLIETCRSCRKAPPWTTSVRRTPDTVCDDLADTGVPENQGSQEGQSSV